MEKIIGNNNVVIFDFDNTIWVWRRDLLDGKNRPNFLNLRINGISTYCEEFGFVPDKMREFIQSLISKNIKIFILSACDNSIEYIDKCLFLKENFGISYNNVIGIGNSNSKVEIIKSLINKYNDKNFIFIDDKFETLKECKKNLSITVYQPLEIIGENSIKII